MELELGLALSSTNHFATTPKLKELDLISHVNCNFNQVYDDNDDDYDSNSSSQSSVNNNHEENNDEDDMLCYINNHGMKKRNFKDESYCLGTKTLPLLVWDKEPNEHNKETNNRLCTSSSFAFNKSEENGIVGWPPIKSQRKKQWQQPNDAQQQHQLLSRGRCFQVGENGGACGGFRSKYVKVQMEGFFITRKIDLQLYQSYESLTPTLLALFGKGQDSVENYKLTYQNKGGDWLLVGDIPWRTFLGSVQRLKLLRRED